MIWVVFNEAQAAAARALSDAEQCLDPRPIDQPSHPLAGSLALPLAVRDAPGYERWAEMLDALDRVEATPDDLFVPLPV